MATDALEAEVLAPPAPGPALRDRTYRLTASQYEAIGHAGILGSKPRVTLWRGRLVEKLTKYPRHNFSSGAVDALFQRLIPDGYHVRAEQPILLNDDSVPEPDLAVIRGDRRSLGDRQPTPADVAILVEVSHSSLADDLGEVRVAYAEAGIAEYWVVDIPNRRLHVFRDPTGPPGAPTYRSAIVHGADGVVPIALGGVEIGGVRVGDLFL